VRIFLKEALLIVVSLFLILCVVEVLLRVTKLATDIPWSKGSRVLGFKFTPNQTGTWIVGKWGDNKATFHMNSDGWNAVRDYTAQKIPGTTRVAVIGDSYVEALNVEPAAAMSAVLENARLQRGLKIEVYPFGISSASASHYLAMMRYVRARFSPDLYIVNIVHNDIQDSLAATTGDRAIYFGVRQDGDSFEEVPPKIYQPSLLRRIIGHWAIARYLYVNLGLMWKLERRDQAGFRVERQNQPRQFEANIDVTKMMGTQEGRQLTKYIFANTLTKLKTTVRSWCF